MIDRGAKDSPRHRPLAPDSNEVHVWKIVLDRTNWSASPAWRLLVPDELARARRFRFEEDRRRFVVCRSNLRMILALYLHCRPAEVLFRTGSHGKPFLEPASHGQRLRFNVSHSHELALVGVTAVGEVGVDIERVRPVEDVDAIVAHHFSPRERRAFTRAAPAERLRTFFRRWTIKEAYLKARGVGLSGPLDAVDVTLGRRPPARLAERDGPRGDGEWTVRLLSPGAGYVAALAVGGRDPRVRQWNWRA